MDEEQKKEEARRAYNLAYKKKHKERLKQQNKEYYSRPEIKAKQKAYHKKYRQENKEKLDAYKKEYYENNKERISEYGKQRLKEHGDRIRQRAKELYTPEQAAKRKAYKQRPDVKKRQREYENQYKNIEIKHINNRTNSEACSALLKYDSIHGKFNAEINFDENHIFILSLIHI